MNTEWKKELKEMSADEKYSLHDYRLDQNEKAIAGIQTDLKEIKDLCVKLDKKLAGIPDSGLSCSLHALKIDDVIKRMEHIETKTEWLKTKIVAWGAVAAVILFLISQVVIPLALHGSTQAATNNVPVAVVDSVQLYSGLTTNLAASKLPASR